MNYPNQNQNLNKSFILDAPINFENLSRLFIYIYIVWIAIFGVWEKSIMGIPLYSLFFIIVSFFCFFYIFSRGFDNIGEGSIVILLLLSVINSIAQGWPILSTVYNAFLYVTPLIFLFLPRAINFDINKVCKAVQVMVVVAGIVSLLVYFGIIDSGLNLNLNITLIDNAIGLLGIATAFYLISVRKRNINSIITLVFSVLVILIGQSRARMALAFIIIIAYIIFLLFIQKKGKLSNLLLLIVLGLVALFIIYTNSNEIFEYLEFSFNKFETMGSDSSSIYRQFETKEHLRLFFKYPFFGVGCGAYNSNTATPEFAHFSAHNMITGLLAMNGLIYWIIFIIVFLYAIIKTIKNFFEKRSEENYFSLVLGLTLPVLTITSAGFGKPATHVFMLIIGIILHDFNKEKNILPDNQMHERDIK